AITDIIDEIELLTPYSTVGLKLPSFRHLAPRFSIQSVQHEKTRTTVRLLLERFPETDAESMEHISRTIADNLSARYSDLERTIGREIVFNVDSIDPMSLENPIIKT